MDKMQTNLNDGFTPIDLREVVREVWGEPNSRYGETAIYVRHWHNDPDRRQFIVHFDHYEEFTAEETGRLASWVQRALGLTISEASDWIYEWRQRHLVSPTSTEQGSVPSTDEEPWSPWPDYWWEEGVPDTWRSGLLRFFPPAIAATVELINQALVRRLVHPYAVCAPSLEIAMSEVPVRLAHSTLGNALKAMDNVFIQKLDSIEVSLIPNFWMKSTVRGTKPHFYAINEPDVMATTLIQWARPRLEEKCFPSKGLDRVPRQLSPTLLHAIGANDDQAELIIEAVQHDLPSSPWWRSKQSRAESEFDLKLNSFMRSLDDLSSTPLSEEILITNPATYRSAFIRGVTSAHPNKPRSQSNLTDQFGISKSSITRVLANAGVKNVPQYARVQLNTVKDFEQQLLRLGRQVRGYPEKLAKTDSDGTTEWWFHDLQTSIELTAKHYLSRGATVEIVFRLANTQEVVSLDSAVPVKPRSTSHPQRNSSQSNKQRSRHKDSYGTTYSPEWALGHVKQWLEIAGWQRDDEFRNPKTGRHVSIYAEPDELLTLFTKAPTRRGEKR